MLINNQHFLDFDLEDFFDFLESFCFLEDIFLLELFLFFGEDFELSFGSSEIWADKITRSTPDKRFSKIVLKKFDSKLAEVCE